MLKNKILLWKKFFKGGNAMEVKQEDLILLGVRLKVALKNNLYKREILVNYQELMRIYS